MPKNIADPTAATLSYLEYKRNRQGVATVDALHFDASADSKPSAPMASNATIDGLADVLFQQLIGTAVPGGAHFEIRIDRRFTPIRCELHCIHDLLHIPNFARMGSQFTAAQRTAAVNLANQALADGLLAAMGF